MSQLPQWPTSMIAPTTTMDVPRPPTTAGQPLRRWRMPIVVAASLVLLLVSYALVPGLAARSIRGAFPAVHADISGVTDGAHLNLGQSVTFSATGSSGKSLSYNWQFSDGQTATGTTVTKTFTQPTTQASVTLVVRDPLAVSFGNGHEDTTSLQFAVFPPPPQASFTSTQEAAFFGEFPVQFDASGSTSQSQITNYAWDFGDPSSFNNTDSSSFSTQTTHDYSQPGTYTVTLTITDDFNQANTTTQTITVTDNSGTGA